MAKKRSTKKKLSPLKLGAIIILAAGGGYLIYSKLLKPYLFKDDTSGSEEIDSEIDTLPPPDTSGSDSVAKMGGGGNSAPKYEAPDLDKKIRKGDKGDLVYRVQIAINKIASARGKSSYYDSDKKKTIKFPISSDKDFGTTTDSAAKFAFQYYRSNGFITLRKAREQWVRSAGYYNKPFPTELASVSNYEDLKKIYDINRQKKAVDDNFNWFNPAGK